MRTTWMLVGWLVVFATTAWAQQQTTSPVDGPRLSELPRAADARTEPPPGETWPVKPSTPMPAAEGVKPERTFSSPRGQSSRQPTYGHPSAEYLEYPVPNPAPYTDSNSKSHHLRNAIQHLEAAGLKDEAARLRPLLEAETRRQNETLLHQKEAQLKALQQEVDRLRAAVGSPEQVMLDVQVIELPIDKLRERAQESEILKSLLEDIDELLPGVGRPGVVDAESKSLAALKTLLNAYGGKILADPKLVGTSGRPARFHQGGAFQVNLPVNGGERISETRLFGTEVDFTPHVLSDGRIRLEVDVRLSEPERDQAGNVSNPPRLSVRELNTGAELRAGQVLVSAMTREESSTGKIQTFFVIRLQRIEAMDVKLPSDS